MGFADLWSRTLVYFGIAEEDEYWDEDGYVTNEELERTYNDRPNVRRLPRRHRDEYDDWTDSEPAVPRAEAVRQTSHAAAREREAMARPRRLEAAPTPNVRVHLVVPR